MAKIETCLECNSTNIEHKTTDKEFITKRGDGVLRHEKIVNVRCRNCGNYWTESDYIGV